MIGYFDENKQFEYENGFYLTSDVYRIGNIIAHYELYKKIVDLPGDVIELGVFKGSSLIQFSEFRGLLENEHARKIIGFDVFGNFPGEERVESDKKFVKEWNEKFKNEFLSKDDIYKSLGRKGINNVELVEGNIVETLPEYLKRNPYTRVALLHIDTDVYEPAKLALEMLFDKMVRGGVIIFDDYATVEGETIAIEEFLKNRDYIINKFRFSHTKPSFIIKK